jgi:two-component system, LytTR family, response regulator
MNVLIVENEKPAAERLQKLLKKTDESLTIAGVTETVEETVNWLLGNPAPDLILMDIQLDDGICFELFDTIKVETPVIFTTAYSEYALQAFRVNSVDYLLKPVQEEALTQAIEKYRNYHSNLHGETLKQLLSELNRQFRNRFLIKIGSHFRSVEVKDVCFFHIVERSVFLRTFSGKEYPVEASLDYIQKSLDPERFFRINRNCLLNIDAISDIISYSSSRLQIKLTEKISPPDESYLVVSREKVSLFKQWIDK